MTTDSPPPPSSSSYKTLRLISDHLLPALLAAALSVKSLAGRWRLLQANLAALLASLSAVSPESSANALVSNLLSDLLATLRSLETLAARCGDPDLLAGKLRLQSDVDVAAGELSVHLHDLQILLRSGILNHPNLHSTAIVLSLPSPSASRADLVLFVRDLFARLQIGNVDLKLKSLESLLQFVNSDPPKLASIIAHEGDLKSLIRLLEPSSHSLIRESAAAAASLLATSSDTCRRILFDEGAVGPLLSLLDAGNVYVKENAAAAIQTIAGDPANAWAVAAYGGISILINACRPITGSAAVQSFAAASLNYISSIDELRASVFEEGAIPVIVDLLSSNSPSVWKNATLCLWSLASFGGEAIRVSIIKEGGLRNLLQLLSDSSTSSDPEISEHTLRAIHALSVTGAEILSASPGFCIQLMNLIRSSTTTTTTRITAAAVLSNLSPADEIKRSMAPSMAAIVKLLESSKPESAQETAARAITSLLTVKSNRKEFARDGKTIMRVVQMLDLQREQVCQKFPVSVILALTAGGGGGCRRQLADAGACSRLQKLADAGVPGANKALQRISGGRIKNLFSSLARRN